MPQTRTTHKSPTSSAKKRVRKRAARLFVGGTGKCKTRTSEGEFTTIKVGKATVRIPKVAANKIGTRNILSKFVRGYVVRAEEAAQTGRAVEYTMRITPEGDAEPVSKADDLDTALDAARKRGRSKIAEILKGDDMLTAAGFGALIGASHETVNVWRRRGEILGLQAATRTVRYPEWQVTEEGRPLPGLPGLLEAFGGQPWAVYRFLRTTHAELGGRTALAALKAGETKAVLDIAGNQAHGAFT